MMTMTDERKKELIREAHELAKEKGWWDEPRTNEECLALILSEACEALEADRKGKRAVPSKLQEVEEGLDLEVPLAFVMYVKDTVEDELADVCIRCFDLAGHMGMWSEIPLNGDFMHPKTMAGYVLRVADKCSTANVPREHRLNDIPEIVLLHDIVFVTDAMAHQLGIDLWRHIELKMAYNKTRPHKHGKKY